MGRLDSPPESPPAPRADGRARRKAGRCAPAGFYMSSSLPSPPSRPGFRDSDEIGSGEPDSSLGLSSAALAAGDSSGPATRALQSCRQTRIAARSGRPWGQNLAQNGRGPEGSGTRSLPISFSVPLRASVRVGVWSWSSLAHRIRACGRLETRATCLPRVGLLPQSQRPPASTGAVWLRGHSKGD